MWEGRCWIEELKDVRLFVFQKRYERGLERCNVIRDLCWVWKSDFGVVSKLICAPLSTFRVGEYPDWPGVAPHHYYCEDTTVLRVCKASYLCHEYLRRLDLLGIELALRCS